MANKDYAHLSTCEQAQRYLVDLSKKLTPEMIAFAENWTLPYRDRYDILRLIMQAEGLQMVIWRNGGQIPETHLPMFFNIERYQKNYGR